VEHEDFARFGRSRKVCDRVVDGKHDRVRQCADFLDRRFAWFRSRLTALATRFPPARPPGQHRGRP
jgi:hypothetical protein